MGEGRRWCWDRLSLCCLPCPGRTAIDGPAILDENRQDPVAAEGLDSLVLLDRVAFDGSDNVAGRRRLSEVGGALC
eukprot:8861116-Pyramimonas_sp.AAC.1